MAACLSKHKQSPSLLIQTPMVTAPLPDRSSVCEPIASGFAAYHFFPATCVTARVNRGNIRRSSPNLRSEIDFRRVQSGVYLGICCGTAS